MSRALISGLTDVVVHCMDCDWREQASSYDDMRRLLGRVQTHAKKLHRIHVWRETLFVYDDKSSPASPQEVPPND